MKSRHSLQKSVLMLICIFVTVSLFQNFAQMNNQNTVVVDSYGARADGVTDSTAAFQAAINAVATSGGSLQHIRLSAGTYFLKCSPPSWMTAVENLQWPLPEGSSVKPYPEYRCLDIAKVTNLTFQGQGIGQTQILIGNPLAGLIGVQSSDNIRISDFSVDYSSLPFSQGKVNQVSVTYNFIDVAVDSGYPLLDSVIFSSQYFPQTFGVILESSLPRVKTTTKGYFANLKFQKLSANVFRVFLEAGDKWSVGGIANGDRFILPTRVSSLLSFYRNSNLTLQNVALYSGPGAGTIWAENKGVILIDGLQVRPKPGTNRLVSVAADAIHMANNAAKVVIRNSYIEGMADDALNIYTKVGTISEVGPYVIQLNHFLPVFEQGQTAQIADPVTAETKTELKLGPYRTLEGEGPSRLNVNDTNSVKVGDVVFVNELASPGAIISNNTFGYFRGHIRLRSPGAVFYRNQFMDSVNAHILVDSDPAYQEGPSLLFNNFKNLPALAENTVKNGDVILMDRLNKAISKPQQNKSFYLNPLVFDAAIYRALNPDLAGYSDESIAVHWVQHGLSEGRQASLHFHSKEYFFLYPDLGGIVSTNYAYAAGHFLLHGHGAENRMGSIRTSSLVYNPNAYRTLNPDLARMNDVQLAGHWVHHGIREGRKASFYFSSREYLSLYDDLSRTFGSTNFYKSIEHYVTTGFLHEKRSGTIQAHASVYNPRDYRNYNPDLRSMTNDELLGHWLMHGISEGRRAHQNFFARNYLNRYPDLGGTVSRDYGYAIRHYVKHGIHEGRVGW